MKNSSSVILLTCIAFGWGLNWPILKIGLEEIPPWIFRSATYLPAGFILLGLGLIKKQSLRIERSYWAKLFCGSLFNMVLWGVFVLYGLTQMTGGRAAILAFTMPVWASLSDSLLSRKSPSHNIILALLLGTIGILLLWLGDSETKVHSI